MAAACSLFLLLSQSHHDRNFFKKKSGDVNDEANFSFFFFFIGQSSKWLRRLWEVCFPFIINQTPARGGPCHGPQRCGKCESGNFRVKSERFGFPAEIRKKFEKMHNGSITLLYLAFPRIFRIRTFSNQSDQKTESKRARIYSYRNIRV